MQVEFCIAELKRDYPALWAYLMVTQNLPEATDRICREYECPAVNNIDVRAKYANELYMRYGEELMRNAECEIRNAPPQSLRDSSPAEQGSQTRDQKSTALP